jgi:hypothetical protein
VTSHATVNRSPRGGVDVYGVTGPSPAVRTLTVKPPSGPRPAPVLKFPVNGATVTAGQQVSAGTIP